MFVSHCTDALMASVFVTIYIIVYSTQSLNIALLSCLLWTLGIVTCLILNKLSCLLWTLAVWSLATVECNLCSVLLRSTDLPYNTKHIDLCYHFVCEAVEEERIILKYITSLDNIADIFMKLLPKIKFQEFIPKLGLGVIKEWRSKGGWYRDGRTIRMGPDWWWDHIISGLGNHKIAQFQST